MPSYVKPKFVPRIKKIKTKKEKVKSEGVPDYSKLLERIRTPKPKPDKKVQKKSKKVAKVPKAPYIKGERLNATFHNLNNRGRLYAKATFMGFKRGQRNQYENVAILSIEGCTSRKSAADYYAGKKCVFMYRCKNGSRRPTNRQKTRYRVIWGKVRRPHGNRGSVRATFKSNLPPRAMGNRVRIMMYPVRPSDKRWVVPEWKQTIIPEVKPTKKTPKVKPTEKTPKLKPTVIPAE